MAAFGLYLDGGRPDDTTAPSIWPQNLKTVRLFHALRTQWRTGMAGATGLDYGVVPAMAKLLKIKLTPARFADLQVMEAAALGVMAEGRRD